MSLNYLYFFNLFGSSCKNSKLSWIVRIEKEARKGLDELTTDVYFDIKMKEKRI